jgi:hypothetical protein
VRLDHDFVLILQRVADDLGGVQMAAFAFQSRPVRERTAFRVLLRQPQTIGQQPLHQLANRGVTGDVVDADAPLSGHIGRTQPKG